jgi:DNA (cytosine-5)-methyltransferase 1
MCRLVFLLRTPSPCRNISISNGLAVSEHMTISVCDFFSGCGGTSAGLKQAGMRIILGLDIDPDAASTFRHNFPQASFVQRDISKMRPNSLSAIIDPLREKGPVLFSGCAPCQPFSKQNGRRNKTDERIPLLKHFGRFVRYFRPEFVLVENVPGLQVLSWEPGPLPQFTALLKRLGYEFITATIDCCDYGVPQKRSRFVLLASSIGLIKLPQKSHGPGTPSLRFSTVADWISDLPALEAGGECTSVINHRAANLSSLNLTRIRATPPGGSRRDWPVELALNCHMGGHKGHTDVYGRLRADQPASALTTRCISLSNGRFGHPTQHRAISIREAASLQTFDRSFVFKGSLNSMARQIGNAVPVLLAKCLGESFVKCARAHNRRSSCGVL